MLNSELENHQMMALNTFGNWVAKESQDEGDCRSASRTTWRGKLFGEDTAASIGYIIADTRTSTFMTSSRRLESAELGCPTHHTMPLATFAFGYPRTRMRTGLQKPQRDQRLLQQPGDDEYLCDRRVARPH